MPLSLARFSRRLEGKVRVLHDVGKVKLATMSLAASGKKDALSCIVGKGKEPALGTASEIFEHSIMLGLSTTKSEDSQQFAPKDWDTTGHEITLDPRVLNDDVVLNIPTSLLRAENNDEETPFLLGEENVQTLPTYGVQNATTESFSLARLTCNLLGYVRTVTKFLDLALYAMFLMPGFIQVAYHYFFSKRVHRNIVYGDLPRNRLDLYLPEDTSIPRPVLIFVTGGAWIIGNKAWGALLGLRLLERDIIVCCIDYRNFPQAGVSCMVEDVSKGIGFVINSIITQYGGDSDRIYLAGQSAGSHLAACALIGQAGIQIGQSERTTSWKCNELRGFLGISGGYNLPNLADHFHSRGLYRSIYLSVMEGETSLLLHSPELQVQSDSFTNGVHLLPPIHLFHGIADFSIPHTETNNFADALRTVGATVTTKLYPGKTHTDLFLQDPMRGGHDELFEDILAVIHADDEEAKLRDAQAPLPPRLVPECFLQMAHRISPF